MLLTNTELCYYDSEILRLPADKRKEYHAQVDRLIAELSRSIRNKTEIKITKVVKAGSFAKFTILRKTSTDPVDVDVVCIVPGQVVSGMNDGPPTAMMPLSEAWVKKALASLAPGFWSKRPGPVIVPWPAHSWSAKAMGIMTRSMNDMATRGVTVGLRNKKQASAAATMASTCLTCWHCHHCHLSLHYCLSIQTSPANLTGSTMRSQWHHWNPLPCCLLLKGHMAIQGKV